MPIRFNLRDDDEQTEQQYKRAKKSSEIPPRDANDLHKKLLNWLVTYNDLIKEKKQSVNIEIIQNKVLQLFEKAIQYYHQYPKFWNANDISYFFLPVYESNKKLFDSIENIGNKIDSLKRYVDEKSMLDSYLAPSKMDQSQMTVLNLDSLSNEDIMTIVSDWLPNQVIKIGPFHFYYLLKDLYKDEIWKELTGFIAEQSDAVACRGELNEDYLKYYYKKTVDIIVLCTTYNPELYNEHKMDLINGVFYAGFTGKFGGKKKNQKIVMDNESAYIIATCFREIKGDLKIKVGLLMRCLGLSLLKRLGKKNIYTEAVNDKLAKYYQTLGFELTSMTVPLACDKINPYEVHIDNKETLDKLYQSIEEKEEELKDDEDDSLLYFMRICNYDQRKICFQAIDSLRKEIKNISEKHLVHDYKPSELLQVELEWKKQ
jgi:hypothetical protein